MRNKKKFNEFMNKTIEELKDEKRYGTAHVYQSTLNAFCEFCGCKTLFIIISYSVSLERAFIGG